MRLALLTSHPVQYQAPLFRELARRIDLRVLFAHRANAQDQADAGFDTAFDWDVDLLAGYDSRFLVNTSRNPSPNHFTGCDTPAIGEALAGGRFDALLVMGWHLKSYVQGILAAKRNRLPVMVRGDSELQTARSLAKRTAKTVIYPAALRVFDAALYVGQRSHEYYRHYGFPTDRLFFSPHCVDNAWFAEQARLHGRMALRNELGLPADAPVVVFAGKLIPRKRVSDIVQAISLVKPAFPAIVLVTAGSGMLADEIDREVAATGINHLSLGFCNQRRMPAVYAAADVFVLASEIESWGLVANEALACGTPIIVSEACGCAADLAADGTAGRTYPTRNIPALADALRAILTSPPLRQAIAAKSAAYGTGQAAEGDVSAMQYLAERRHRSIA